MSERARVAEEITIRITSDILLPGRWDPFILRIRKLVELGLAADELSLAEIEGYAVCQEVIGKSENVCTCTGGDTTPEMKALFRSEERLANARASLDAARIALHAFGILIP